MKTMIPANNYTQAAAELESISKGLSANIKSEIDANDNGHFTIALVRSTDNPVSKKYDHAVSIQQLNARAFEKMESNLAVTGYDKMIIIHNPDPSHKRNTKMVALVPGSPASTANNQTIESPSEMEARLRAEFAKKYENHVSPEEAEKLKNATPASNVGATPETPEAMEARLRAEFELKFGPDTDPEVIKGDDFLAVTQDGATLKINFSNLDLIVDEADETNVVMIGDFNDETTVPNLKKFAEDNKIDIKGLVSKGDILLALKAWKEDNVK